jgi:hypothetical protein
VTPSNGETELRRLRAALEHLAWPAARQRDYLIGLGVAPLADELALEFDDAFRPVDTMPATLGLSAAAQESLLAVDHTLEAMSNSDSHVWQVDSLAGSTKWAEIRRLAAMVLGELPSG